MEGILAFLTFLKHLVKVFLHFLLIFGWVVKCYSSICLPIQPVLIPFFQLNYCQSYKYDSSCTYGVLNKIIEVFQSRVCINTSQEYLRCLRRCLLVGGLWSLDAKFSPCTSDTDMLSPILSMKREILS